MAGKDRRTVALQDRQRRSGAGAEANWPTASSTSSSGRTSLLQKDVKFSRLGLVVIDEEHRFGVRQKEALKALRAEVDVLTLTATPIPRTLACRSKACATFR
jgi:superfamily II DNA or RNA helicase